MKVSLNWLTDYVDINMAAAALAELLTNIGLNCDGIEETASDVVFVLDVTSNRPDCLGHLGIAREISAATGAAFRPPAIGKPATAGNVADLTSVRVDAPDLCPRYTARVIRGVKVGPSPAWLVERLAAVGMRSVNNVVDVTNFVLMEYSQPLHSFDYDKLAGGKIIVRRAARGEIITSIDGTKCEMDESILVIADAKRPVAIAGIMGGLDTEVAGSTVNLLIESAQFDPLTIRRGSRKLGIMSESNYRFERGVDPVALDEASMRACDLIIQLAGGTLAEGMADAWAKPYVAPAVALRTARCNAVLGVEVPVAAQVGALERLGLAPRVEGERIICTIPSRRRDLEREIDLIEEVARLHGYDKIPVANQVRHEVKPMGADERLRKLAQSVMSAAGFDEALTFSFVDAPEAVLLGVAEPVAVDQRVRKSNNVLRPSLLPSLLRACKVNQDAGTADLDLWELASIFPPGAGGSALPAEHTELAMITTEGVRRLRGAVEALVQTIAPQAKLTVAPGPVPAMAADASASLLLDGEPIGSIGNVAANVLHYYGLEKPLAAAALDFAALTARAQLTRVYQPIPRFPSVQRDLSLIVDEQVTWRQVEGALAQLKQEHLAEVEYVTTYRGKPIAAGRKSVTVRLTYRSPEGTLRGEQVDQAVEAVIRQAKDRLSAELRV